MYSLGHAYCLHSEDVSSIALVDTFQNAYVVKFQTVTCISRDESRDTRGIWQVPVPRLPFAALEYEKRVVVERLI